MVVLCMTNDVDCLYSYGILLSDRNFGKSLNTNIYRECETKLDRLVHKKIETQKKPGHVLPRRESSDAILVTDDCAEECEPEEDLR